MADKGKIFRPAGEQSLSTGGGYLHGLGLLLFYAGITLGTAMVWQAANKIAEKFFTRKKEE